MATVTQHAPGTFCWVELGTTDQMGAKRFYAALFDWGYEDTQMGPDEVYTIAQTGGRDAAALYRMPAQMLQQGMPPHWMCYVSVSSADEAATKVKALGGTVVAEPFDAMEHGRMAVMQDPTGAAFAVWQAKTHKGLGVVGETGSLCWTELGTNDSKKAAAFYSGLFSWKAEKSPGPMEYTLFKLGEVTAAGMMTHTGEMKAIPSHWMPYFAVKDCDGSAAKAKQMGGDVLLAPKDIPGEGRFAVLRDPQGAVFCILKPGR
jgi:hypothetical protein